MPGSVPEPVSTPPIRRQASQHTKGRPTRPNDRSANGTDAGSARPAAPPWRFWPCRAKSNAAHHRLGLSLIVTALVDGLPNVGEIQAEIARLIAADGLPAGITGDAPIYFVVTPPDVNSCFPNGTSCADMGVEQARRLGKAVVHRALSRGRVGMSVSDRLRGRPHLLIVRKARRIRVLAVDPGHVA